MLPTERSAEIHLPEASPEVRPKACEEPSPEVSRRGFLKALGLGATATASAAASISASGLLGAADENVAGILGPGAVPITLRVNGQKIDLQVEPRITLLDALRDHSHAGKADPVDLTGSKRVCDRASCGACTMIIDGRTHYACTVLAVDAVGREIRTVEGLERTSGPGGATGPGTAAGTGSGTTLHPVQEAFIHHDGLMCGFCTPGFIMASVALLERNPGATPAEIRRGLDGNICRCGTQCRVLDAVEDAGRKMKG